jgi:hypothetical protein
LGRGRVALLGLFLVTRLALAWMADGVTPYPEEWVDGDIYIYETDARAMSEGALPYVDLDIEYPPGSLPSILVPALLSPTLGYRTAFIAVSMLVDAAGFAGLLLLARRWGSDAGPWLWVIGVPLLGPLVYLRFDMVPAVVTILALERVAAGRVAVGGAWLGYGAITKIYPGMLALPVLAATRKPRLLVGAALAAALPLAALAAVIGPGSLVALVTDVLGYHTARGIQVESTWATGLLTAGALGVTDVSTNYSFFAHHVEGAVTPLIKTIALGCAVAALALGTWLGYRTGRRVERGEAAALSAFATLALLLATGTVYSTQYTLWLVAVGAVVACLTPNPLRVPVALLPLVSFLSQMGYPFRYGGLLRLEPRSIAWVGTRNGLVVLIALWSVVALVRLPRPVLEPVRKPEPERVGVG